MKDWLRNEFQTLSIKRKLFAIIITSLLIAMIIASLLLIIYDRNAAKDSLAKNLELTASMVSKRSSAALAFNDKNALRENLETLRTLPGYIAACVYDKSKKLYLYDKLSHSIKVCPKTTPMEPGSIFNENTLQTLAYIDRNNVNYGSLFILYSLNEVNKRTGVFSLITLLVSALSILIALFITRKLQGSFTYPIISLNAIADLVSQTQDYAVRAPLHSQDEVGNLVRSFNSMLNIIQQKHISLNEAITELQQTSADLEAYAKNAEERGAEFQQLLASASHDLRQPLQAMAIFVEALATSANSNQVQLVKKLDMAIENMSQLFSDLLDYSRMQSRHQANFVEEPVNLKQLLLKVSHEFEAMANDKDLFVRFRADELLVIGHSTSIERIIRNLLSNALRYTETGGILISCRKRGGGVVVEVFDSGIGIKPESMTLIFDSYVQEENRSEAQSEGVGLGLSIVKRLCNLMNYQLEVISKLGKGTRFRIIIPANKCILEDIRTSAANCEIQLENLASILPQQQILANKAIFLIDDDPEVLEQLKTLLTSWGAEVTSAESLAAVHEKISQLKSNPPDIIVSDYQIGNIETGADAIDLIRIACNVAVPAIIVTGIEDEAELDILRNQGYSVLKKPVRPAKLRAAINFKLSH